MAGACECGNEPSGWGIAWLADDLLGSQEWLIHEVTWLLFNLFNVKIPASAPPYISLPAPLDRKNTVLRSVTPRSLRPTFRRNLLLPSSGMYPEYIRCSSFLSRDSTVHSHCCEDLNTLWRRFVDIYPSSKSISHMWGTWNAITVATWSVAPWFSKGQGFRHRLGHKCRPLHTLFCAVLSPVDSGLEICPFPTNYVPVHGHFWTSKVA